MNRVGGSFNEARTRNLISSRQRGEKSCTKMNFVSPSVDIEINCYGTTNIFYFTYVIKILRENIIRCVMLETLLVSRILERKKYF